MHRTGIAHPYTGVIKAKCHYYVFQHTRGLRHFYSPVFIMRLLSAVLVLLNIAYHDTCGGGRLCRTGAFCVQPPEILRRLAMGEGYGRMGMIGDLGQMGQMMRRNGNVFQMLPIKKKWENVGILPKQWGRFLQNPTYIFLLFLQEKKKA